MVALPDSLPPRGLNREQAAEYVGVGPETFNGLVKKREMPLPHRLGGRVVWDRVLLDRALDALSGLELPENLSDDPWEARLRNED